MNAAHVSHVTRLICLPYALVVFRDGLRARPSG